MNSTKITLAAIFIAATLVVAGTLAATTTPAAFAYLKKKDDKKDKERDGGNNNGNTITAQINKQKASQSGWDNVQTQDADNTICTHPGSNATCVNEIGAGAGQGIVCASPLISASLFVEGGPLVCVNPDLLTNPNPGGQCPGQQVDVFIDSTHKCLGGPPT
jgi:hypothetical protein